MAAPTETFQDFHFPKAGVHKASAFGRQPVRPGPNGVHVRTTVSAANVRGFDPRTNRDRGGSRPGLTKFIETQVNDEFIIQHLNLLVTTDQAGATMQTSLSGRVVSVLAVSQGVVKVANPGATAWASVTNNTGQTPALNFTGVMQSAQNNQKLYFADGTNWVYYAPVTNSLETWTATAGVLPIDTGVAPDNKPRLICTWRGRTVLSGLLLDPQNWFMSAVSDPHDFDYGRPAPVPPTAAVAGNNANLGLIGDVVTGMCPYSDDILIFFGDHTVYMMRGDPMAGGQIDLVSDAIGAAFGVAWCKDPYGNVYFFSNKCGIYRFVPGQQAPIRVSQPIENLVQDVNTGENIVTMIWNDREQGFQVFITPGAEPGPTTHYFWDMRMGAWWPDSYLDDDMNPVTCVAFDGNRPTDRRLLIGSWDGYVRELDPTAELDDGELILSSVYIGPILTQEMDEMLLKEIQCVLGNGSDPITYEIFVGETAELALASAAAITGVWSADRNNTNPIRRSGHAIYIKLSAGNKWALESIRTRFAGRGKVRRRG